MTAAPEPLGGEVSSPWGRVASDGTVYVRTPAGERVVGSWQAGSPKEGLAYYERRYDELATEVSLLEQRLGAGAAPRAVRERARKLLETLPSASAVGDLDALASRLAAVAERAEQREAEHKAARAEAAAAAAAAKQALVTEAEQLAQSDQWKAAGDRLTEIVAAWKAAPAGDRRSEQELWRRLSAAREEFARRRGAHFAALDTARKQSAATKQELAERAEQLATATDWNATAAAFRELMAAWKSAGRAGKATDDALWERFRAAQSTFFERRAEHFAERDAATRAVVAAREALLTEAEALDVAGDPAGAARALRDIQARWDAAGRVPREAATPQDRRLSAVADRVRAAAEERWRRPAVESSPLVIRLRESVAKLTARAERARREGRAADAEAAESALATQREWLAQAERVTR